MTRINAFISTHELCDQHLLAEYRELPRMVAFCVQRLAKYRGELGPRFDYPTLGEGHMSYFLPYGDSLCIRQAGIVLELQRRGFSPEHTGPLVYPGPMGRFPVEHCQPWRAILIPRITERLKTMKRKPTWTKSTRPYWSLLCN